jgi:hypothetical protein
VLSPAQRYCGRGSHNRPHHRRYVVKPGETDAPKDKQEDAGKPRGNDEYAVEGAILEACVVEPCPDEETKKKKIRRKKHALDSSGAIVKLNRSTEPDTRWVYYGRGQQIPDQRKLTKLITLAGALPRQGEAAWRFS